MKPENVMIHEDNHIRIVDFGAVIYVGRSISSTPDAAAAAIYEISMRSLDSQCIASLPAPKSRIKPHHLSKHFPSKLKSKMCSVFQPNYEDESMESVHVRGRSNTSTESNITSTAAAGLRTRFSSVDYLFVSPSSGEESMSAGVEYSLRPRAFTITGMN